MKETLNPIKNVAETAQQMANHNSQAVKTVTSGRSAKQEWRLRKRFLQPLNNKAPVRNRLSPSKFDT